MQNNVKKRANARQVLDSMRRYGGYRTDTALATALGRTPQVISGWVRRDRVPVDDIIPWALAHGVSLDDLLLVDVDTAREQAGDYPGGTQAAELVRYQHATARVIQHCKRQALELPGWQLTAVIDYAYRHRLDAAGVRELLSLLDNTNTGDETCE